MMRIKVQSNTLYAMMKKSPFIIINDIWIKKLQGDTTTAIILGKLINMYKYLEGCHKLEENNSFFTTVDYLKDNFGYTQAVQKRALTLLEQMGFLEYTLIGFPKQRFITLNIENILQLYEAEDSRQKKIYTDKKKYYEHLNESFYQSSMKVENLITINTNISMPLLEFMFAWSRTYLSHSLDRFDWTPENFGKLRWYFKPEYVERKPFDYRRLRDYTNKVDKTANMNILGFIDWDQCEAEQSPQHAWDINSYFYYKGFGVNNGNQ